MQTEAEVRREYAHLVLAWATCAGPLKETHFWRASALSDVLEIPRHVLAGDLEDARKYTAALRSAQMTTDDLKVKSVKQVKTPKQLPKR